MDELGEIRRLQHAVDDKNGIAYVDESEQLYDSATLPEGPTPPRLRNPTTQALKPALKSPSPSRVVPLMISVRPSLLDIEIESPDAMEDQHMNNASKLATCGTPPKKSMMNSRGVQRPPSAIPTLTSASTIMV